MGILKDIGDAAGAAVDKVGDLAEGAVDMAQDALGFGDKEEETAAAAGADMAMAAEAGAESSMAGAEAAVNTYTVQSGDNLSKIAAHYGTTWQKIFEANRDKINNPDLIHPGQELTIPTE